MAKRKRRRLSAKEKSKIARKNDVLHRKRRAKGGDLVMMRPKPDDSPSAVVRYVPDENGDLVKITDESK